MFELFNKNGKELMQLDELQKASWINVTQPTHQEKRQLIEELGVKEDFITDSLDPSERPHLDQEDDQLFVVIDLPFKIDKKEQEYATIPLGIVLLQDCVITISDRSFSLLNAFKENKVKNFSPQKRFRFVYQIANQAAQNYLNYLHKLNKKREEIERELRKSMKNEELYSLLDLKESIVYFTTSLKANEAVLEKIMKLEVTSIALEEKDLMQDALVETRQALTMANTYGSILSNMMDAFASVISNNLNIVMKFLTSLAIIIAIPTVITSFYGMNIALPLQHHPYAFIHILLLSIAISLLVAILLAQKKMF